MSAEPLQPSDHGVGSVAGARTGGDAGNLRVRQSQTVALDGIPGLLPRATAESVELVRRNVPDELQKLPAWVCGDRSPKGDKAGTSKSSKAPINPRTGRMARSNDSTTWGTLAEAIEYAVGDARCFGVGVNLMCSDFVGLDLDHVVDPATEVVTAAAAELIRALPRTYTERSPSGTGLRMFYRGTKPTGMRGCTIKDAFGPGTALEVYDGASGGRYLTVTGDICGGQALAIANVSGDDLMPIVALQAKKRKAAVLGKERSRNGVRQETDDLERARWGLLDAKLLHPDVGYDGWLRVGVALKPLGDPGLELWDAWSKPSKNYDSLEINSKWPGLDGSSLGSLFGMFDDADPGWRDRFPRRAALGALSNGSDGGVGPTDGHEDGLVPLGQRDPETGRFVFSARRTLPTAQAYVRDFHWNREGRTVHSYAGRLWEWRQNCYVEVEDESVTQRLHSWLHDALTYRKQSDGTMELVPFDANPNTVSSALKTIRSHVHLPASTTTPSWLDDRQWPSASEILPCRSMNVHIPTAEVLQPTPLLFNTNALEFDFDPAAPTPERWLGFLAQLFGEDTESIKMLQEWFGYCLVADTSQQKILLMVGPRRSGKGTIARVLTNLVGAGNVCGPTVGSLAGPFGLQPLLGKSLALVSDARFHGENISTVVERLLCISGEDAVSVDRKFLNSVTMKLPTRFMFLTNEMPRFNDASTALAGRFLVLKLTHSYYGKEDVTLTSSLLVELPGILTWALEGWRRLKARGRFQVPESSRNAVQDIEDLSSPVQAFVRDCCRVGTGHRVTMDQLYAAWRVWCSLDGRTTITTRQAFGRDLNAAVPGIVLRRSTAQASFYDGIGLVQQDGR